MKTTSQPAPAQPSPPSSATSRWVVLRALLNLHFHSSLLAVLFANIVDEGEPLILYVTASFSRALFKFCIAKRAGGLLGLRAITWGCSCFIASMALMIAALNAPSRDMGRILALGSQILTGLYLALIDGPEVQVTTQVMTRGMTSPPDEKVSEVQQMVWKSVGAALASLAGGVVFYLIWYPQRGPDGGGVQRAGSWVLGLTLASTILAIVAFHLSRPSSTSSERSPDDRWRQAREAIRADKRLGLWFVLSVAIEGWLSFLQMLFSLQATKDVIDKAGERNSAETFLRLMLTTFVPSLCLIIGPMLLRARMATNSGSGIEAALRFTSLAVVTFFIHLLLILLGLNIGMLSAILAILVFALKSYGDGMLKATSTDIVSSSQKGSTSPHLWQGMRDITTASAMTAQLGVSIIYKISGCLSGASRCRENQDPVERLCCVTDDGLSGASTGSEQLVKEVITVSAVAFAVVAALTLWHASRVDFWKSVRESLRTLYNDATAFSRDPEFRQRTLGTAFVVSLVLANVLGLFDAQIGSLEFKAGGIAYSVAFVCVCVAIEFGDAHRGYRLWNLGVIVYAFAFVIARVSALFLVNGGTSNLLTIQTYERQLLMSATSYVFSLIICVKLYDRLRREVATNAGARPGETHGSFFSRLLLATSVAQAADTFLFQAVCAVASNHGKSSRDVFAQGVTAHLIVKWITSFVLAALFVSAWKLIFRPAPLRRE